MASKFYQLAILFSLVTLFVAAPCPSSQYTANDGNCLSCPSTCTTCANADYCTSCNLGYYLVVASFNVTCQTCSQIFGGCKTCLSNVACTACNEGYFISNNICRPCSTSTLYCTKCSVDGSICSACNYPFILQGGMCVSQTVSNVITINTTTTTTTPTTNTTVPVVSNLITLANGTKVVPVLDVNGCNQIQIFNNGKCIKIIDHCTLYQATGLCQYCDTGYQITIFGDCSPTNYNLACESGYWLDKVQDKCVAVDISCDWYYPNNGSCYNCSKGYILKDQLCIPSVQCNSRQFFYQGTCVNVPGSCSTFTSTGVCTKCATGYNLKQGICNLSFEYVTSNLCTFPCRTCHYVDTGFCFSCQFSYQLSGAQYGRCIPVVN